MKHPKVTLTAKSYYGMALYTVFLIIAALGGIGDMEWAENIYTFVTVLYLFLLIFSTLVKSELKPIKQYIALYFLHVLFNAAMGWWWLTIWWIIIIVCAAICMGNWTAKYNKGEK